MAKLERQAAVTETKVVVVKPATITLELTEQEAKVIRTLVGYVGGYGRFREVSDRIYYAMVSVETIPNFKTNHVGHFEV